jgi:hypothetical protein
MSVLVVENLRHLLPSFRMVLSFGKGGGTGPAVKDVSKKIS